MRAHRWIPRSALLDGRVEQCLTQCVDQWQIDWFGRAVGKVVPADRAESVAKGQAFCTDKGLRIVLGEGGRVPVIAACLGLDPLAHVSTENDKQCLHRLVLEALSDLAERIGTLSGVEALTLSEREQPPAMEAHSSVSLCGPDGDVWFDLRVTSDVATRLRLAHLADVEPDALAGNLEDALERHNTHLRAKAGQFVLSLQAVEAMRAGDVMVLDTKLADSFEVLADGRRVSGVRCRYVRVQTESSEVPEAAGKDDHTTTDTPAPISGGFIMEADHG